ncbi:PD-(D/E)XK nuclease family protein [Halolamina salina]|uniref:PD-(D/E)XK nuclease superfamily protein n=1 Tax=Halolamina salina TaxID=1220023 RepID=A0ABD6B9Y8_9EURY
MALRARTDSFIEYLQARSEATNRTPARHPQGMCILSGQLLRQNLKDHLDREGIPTAPLAHFTTIEELATDLLEPTDDPHRMLAGGVRDRLVEGILAAVDPQPPDEVVPPEDDDVLGSRERNALAELASRLPYTEEDTRETLLTELDDYFRWTDAATDVSPAMEALVAADNRFAQQQTNRSMSAFRGIERFIKARLETHSIDRQQSRSHLVHAARDHVSEQWTAQFSHVDWIAVSGISVFDNPTLRFLATIASEPSAPDVVVFNGSGSNQYNAARFDALPVETSHETPEQVLPDLESSAAATLFRATSAAPEDVPEAVSFTEAPTDQRAVERVATEVRELVQEGVHPRDILIVAPDAGSYQSLIEQAFETVEVPVHVETRRPYVNIPAYRCFQTFVEVVDAVANDEPITFDELVDPLRLGYCPRGSQGYRWPIDGRSFTKVEQEIHRKQQFYNRDPDRYEDQGITFETWRDLIDEIPHWTGPWEAVNEYLEDIAALADSPPETGEALTDLFGRYLGTYVFQTVDHERSLYTGPAIDTTRTTLSEIHPTSEAERVRNALDDVGAHYDRVQTLFDAPASWQEIARAFATTIGGQTYGKRHLDQYAVPVVDAGNAYFREADHLYLLGMDADVFPGEAPTSTFLHNEVRRTVHDRAAGGETPYHHLDSRETVYSEALDFYQAALSTASPETEITLVHTYHDGRGNDISWSPFVDLFDVDEEPTDEGPVDRISVGDWIPQRESGGESWQELANRIAPRERLRMLLYQAHRDTPEDDPEVTAAHLDTIVDTLATQPLSDLILPRVDRYHTPPTAVTIEPDEPAFADTSLEAVTGDPLFPHELDLASQCGLKYYYYQFLYNYTGGEPERAKIPKYYSGNPHYRLGELPYIVRENYADPRYVEKWKQIVTNLLPDRQSRTDGLAQFDSDEELREWVEQEPTFDSYDLNTIYQNLQGERQLVEAELSAGITRTWDWRDGGTVTVDGHVLGVPAYRVDTIDDGESTYAIPTFFTRFSKRGMSALKACFDGAIWEADERTGELCLNCGSGDSCQYHSKYVIDHRMLAGHRYETDVHDQTVIGIAMQEQYAGPTDGDRVVALQTNHTDRIHGDDDTEFEQLVARGYPNGWTDNVSDWEQNFTTMADTLEADGPITLEANSTLVNQDDCLDCVYRDLCAIPDSGVNIQ